MVELEHSVQHLRDLAESDASVRPLALLQLEMLQSIEDPVWERSAAGLTPGGIETSQPLIHEKHLTVDVDALNNLFKRLAASARSVSAAGSDRLLSGPSELDPIVLLRAAIVRDHVTIEREAARLQVDPTLLATIGHLSSLPLLYACGNAMAGQITDTFWMSGYCPLCGDWPILAEIRGLNKIRWLRCGRCATAWQSKYQQCVYCGTSDHDKLGYLAPEEARESRRAVTCDACHGYLKTFTTVSPLSFPELLLRDLNSVELDIAALDSGYSRPAECDFTLDLHITAAQPVAWSWLPWR